MDETQSQEQAFTTLNENQTQGETFTFDEVKESAPESQPNAESKEEENEESSASPVGTEEDEQKVPYSRFKRKIDELTESTSKIQYLEERLRELENNRNESVSVDDIELPKEWVKLYGDSDIAKEAYLIQLKRDEQIQEQAVQKALERISKQQEEEISRLSENEEIIEENLSSLSESIGKKLTAKQEEDILSIVDEFSPVGNDGKYLSLFPFDKAYEIYTLRNASKGQATRRARESVSDLSSLSTTEEPQESLSPNRKGWDSWREAL